MKLNVKAFALTGGMLWGGAVWFATLWLLARGHEGTVMPPWTISTSATASR